MRKSSAELQLELEAAQQRERWEKEKPQAIQDAFARGKVAGFVEGWQAASRWLGQMALSCADLHRTSAGEPAKVSLERIADMLSQLTPAPEGEEA